MVKTIATMGPMIATEKEIKNLMNQGLMHYWINLGLNRDSYGYFSLLQTMKAQRSDPIEIIVDLPSNRCRYQGKKGKLEVDRLYKIYDADLINEDDRDYIVLSGLNNIIKDLAIGEKICIGDGLAIFSIRNIDSNYVEAFCDKLSSNIREGSSCIFSGKDKDYNLIRKEDEIFLKRLASDGMKPDYLAISFCKNESDISFVKNLVNEIFNCRIKVLAKIQNKTSIQFLEEIINNAEGVVIERGDLLYAVDAYQLPYYQDAIITKAKANGKITIVSTGFMSEYAISSTINRSELSDVYRVKEEECDFLLLTKESGHCTHSIATINLTQKILGEK